MGTGEKLLNTLESKGISGAIISSPENRRYFSGFSGSNGTLLLFSGRSTLITDFRYQEQAKRETEGFEIVIAKRNEELSALGRTVAEGVQAVGFEAERVSFAQYERLRSIMPKGVGLIPIDSEISALRAVKAPQERSSIRKAAGIADAVFTYMLTIIKPGMTEIDVAAEIEYQMKRRGAEGSAFAPIVASGANAALPHAQPSPKKLENGELVVMDFGARVEGYCSDMTRTIALGGVSPQAREIYGIVLEAQLTALEALRPGLAAKEADNAARKVIAAAGYAEQFGHGLGHGVGIDVHEAPTLNAASFDTLSPGMVVTVEPGIYIPESLGVRIEDLCLICSDGTQNFTSSTKEIVVL